MANPTNLYWASLGLQQPSASDLTDGTSGSGAIALVTSPAFLGSPTAPTQSALDNSTKLATTAYVDSATGGSFVNPMTTLGDMIYENATPTAARLAGNTTTTKKYLSQTGTGVISAAPLWAQIAAADLSDGTTGTGAIVLAGSPALTGTPTAPTVASPIDNSTKLATTAFVQSAVTGGIAGSDVLEVNGTVVANPFTVSLLANGVAPVGETQINGSLVRNGIPCLQENTQINLSSLRTIGTVYQNPYSVPMLVILTLLSNTASALTFTAFSDGATSPSTQVYKATSPNVNSYVGISFFVLPNQFYKVTTSSGSPSIINWREFQLSYGTFADSGEIHGSRSLSTVFQNTTGNAMFVVAQINSVTSASTVQGLSDTQSTGPTNVINDSTQTSGASNTVTVFMPVPPGHYYKVTAASGSLALWHEYTWAVPITKTVNLVSTSPGFGQTRSMLGVSLALNVAGAAATTLQAQNWQNDSSKVRWIQCVGSQPTNSSGASLQFNSGDGIPPFLTMMNVSCHATVGMTIFGPIMPWKYYNVFNTLVGSGTLTQTSWFEYQLG